jgi:photosystem II stability/assembly factor-like uncharacterized protein
LSLACLGLAALFLAPCLAAAEECEMIGLSSGGSIFNPSCSPHDAKVFTVATDMSGSFITYDAGAEWHMIQHRQLSHSMSCPAAFHPSDPKTIYWVQESDVKVTHDAGVTWTPICESQPWRGGERLSVVRIELDPDYPQNMFVGTGDNSNPGMPPTAGALYRSADAGKTWQACAGVTGRVFHVATQRQSAAGSRVYFVGTSDAVFRSDDGGKTWAKKTQNLAAGRLLGFAGASNDKETILYAAVECSAKGGALAGGIYRSKDKGETWERVMNPKINTDTKKRDEYGGGDVPQYKFLAAADKNPQRAYVYGTGTSFHPPGHATVYRTDDAGQSWQEVFFSDPRFKDKGMECNVETDWETETWGQRYQTQARGLEISQGNPDEATLVVERSIFYTLDAGKTWKSPHRGTSSKAVDGETQYCNSGEVVTSTWNYVIDPFEHNRHYICYTDISFARSLDGGKSWIPDLYSKNGLNAAVKNTTYELAFDPEVKGRIWCALSASHDIPNENGVFKHGTPNKPGCVAVSDDFAQHWKPTALAPKHPVLSVVVDPKSPKEKRTLYASVFGEGVFRSDDAGATWAPKNKGLDPAKRCLKLVLHQDGTLFVATTGNQKGSPEGTGLFKSTDRGETWTSIGGPKWEWIRDYTVKPDDSNTILVPTSRSGPIGLQRTTDGGKTWKTIFQPEGETHFFGAFYHPTNKGWIYFTEGEGARQYGLYLSKDDGATWKPFTQVPFAGIQRVTFDPDDPKHIYLSTFGASIIKAPAEP